MKTGCLGKSPITFSRQVADSLDDPGEIVGFDTHGEIFDAVMSREVDRGIFALENQLAGIVDECLHAIIQPILAKGESFAKCKHNIRITKELAVPVELFLFNQSGNLNDIKIVRSHSIPLKQAQGRLDELSERYHFKRESCPSTDAAALAASEDPSIASISSVLTSSHYINLKNIRRIDDQIQNNKYKNVTRFWMVELRDDSQSLELPPSDETYKICVLFNLAREIPGALGKALQVFANAGLNLAQIYSLPRRDRSWEYTFVAEYEIDYDPNEENKINTILSYLRFFADFTVLGVYPRYDRKLEEES